MIQDLNIDVYIHMSMKYEDMKRLAKKMLEKMREYKMA